MSRVELGVRVDSVWISIGFRSELTKFLLVSATGRSVGERKSDQFQRKFRWDLAGLRVRSGLHRIAVDAEDEAEMEIYLFISHKEKYNFTLFGR